MTCVVELDHYVYVSFRVLFFFCDRAVPLAIETEDSVLMHHVYRE